MSLQLWQIMSKDCIDIVATLLPTFNKDAVMYGFNNGALLGCPINILYSFVKKNGTAHDIKTRLDVPAITPTTEVVHVGMENDAIGAECTDFHTLINLMALGKSWSWFITNTKNRDISISLPKCISNRGKPCGFSHWVK
jgi:hypothetical protein